MLVETQGRVSQNYLDKIHSNLDNNGGNYSEKEAVKLDFVDMI